MRVRKAVCVAIILAFCVLLPLTGQDSRGTLLGRVTDTSGAVMAGVKVESLNTSTGVRNATVTNGSGDYSIPFLIPGPYTITVVNSGFKTFTRPGILVRMNDRITIDVTMELGLSSQTVEVKAESPLLDTSTASMGQVMNSRSILELPLMFGSVITMAGLAPGVLSFGMPAYVRPFDESSQSNMSIDGANSGTNQFMVDGAADTQNGNIAYAPPPGVVEEVKVQTATFDASYGFTGGAAVNFSLKSGTNGVHGQTYYFIQNPVFNADKFFRTEQGKTQLHSHRWGASISGPVYLPKLYDGRNKTFWMYGYEGMLNLDPTPFQVYTVPTSAQKAGDFSALLAVGSNYQIYDPYSIAPAPNGRFSRQPLAGNRIPDNLINPIARKISLLYDPPNQPGQINGVNNFVSPMNEFDHYWNHIVRIDHNLSERQRFYVRADITANERPEWQRMNGAYGDFFFRYNRGVSFDDVYVLSPRFIINSRYTLTRFIFGRKGYQIGWDLAGLGFSQHFINQIPPYLVRLPEILVSGYHALADSDYTQGNNRRHSNIHELASNITSITGQHTLRYGFAYRAYQENTWSQGMSSGSFSFGSTWTAGPLDNSPAAPIGQGLASFLYGLPDGGGYPIPASFAAESTIWALYFQDDWKLSRKLTLSLGLRYELPSPMTERFNRSVRGFDTATASPIQAQVLQNYAASPIPAVPVSQFKVVGGLTFAGVGGNPRTLWGYSKKNLMPRMGFAYSLTPKTVLRGGYGIFFDAFAVINVGVIQTGFSRTTNYVASTDNGLHFTAPFADPFPNGFLQPFGASLGVSTNLGQGINFFSENLTNPYMQRWQFALQRELPMSSMIEVAYVGNRGTRMLASRDFNPTPRQYYSTLPTRDQTAINFLSANVSNPFYPLLPGTGLASTNVSQSQLLKPYPQFTSMSSMQNQGYSWYHSLQVRFEKRFSSGLNATLSYTWSKMMEATSYLNSTDIRPEEVISGNDRTQRVVVSFMYELPFGQSRRWKTSNAALSKMISGWQVTGIYLGMSGPALGFGNAIFNGSLKDIPLPRDQQSPGEWFNVNAGFERNSAKQLGSNIRTFPSRFSGIRGDGRNNWDLSAIKNTQLNERVQLQFRAEAINALNHPQFSTPNTSVTSTAFGQVTSEQSNPRTIQFGLKILF